jgi:ABC-type transport system substrate-binding protein
MRTPRKRLIAASVIGAAAAGGLFGATVLAPGVSSAATTSSTATGSSTPQSSGTAATTAHDPTKGGHMANGITEALLTGDTATKVKAAATAAVPGGTIQRVENDAEGSAYEAHMTKADGSHATVKIDASFKVTSVEAGMR